MNFRIVSPDATGFVDPPVLNLLNRLLKPVDKLDKADFAVIPITRHNITFNPKLLGLKKPYILVCFSEYGWDWNQKVTHKWGENTSDFVRADYEGLFKFDNFVRENPPLITFKRELLLDDETDKLKPIEYLVRFDIPEVEPEARFLARPIEVTYNWGRSNEVRCRLHGDIYTHSISCDYNVVSNWDYVNREFQNNSKRKIWVSVHVPHYARTDMKTVMQINGWSKVSISMPGAGVKCFRSLEAPLNSVMAIADNNLAWSYPWMNGVNCIVLDSGIGREAISPEKHGIEVDTIIEFLNQPEVLYTCYENGVENAKNYIPNNYLKNYIIPSIQKVL